jgi:hypothetical protein
VDLGRYCRYRLRVGPPLDQNNKAAAEAWMRWGVVRRAFHAPHFRLSRLFGVLAIAALALGVAGCASQSSLRLASLGPVPAASGVTIAFDSIDGPPPEVFRRLVANLNDEAQTRKIAVVSRSSPAVYRVRGYVSAVVERDKTSFGWVWDIYNSDRSRVLRITGEEPAPPGRRRDAWAGADDRVLRRMASDGMDRIATFLNSGEPPSPAAPAVEPAGVTLASARDDSPEAAGIFRLFGATETTGSAPASEPAEAVPVPPKRAKPSRREASASGNQ